jgi:hypothetical protein
VSQLDSHLSGFGLREWTHWEGEKGGVLIFMLAMFWAGLSVRRNLGPLGFGSSRTAGCMPLPTELQGSDWQRQAALACGSIPNSILFPRSCAE